jgi:hypothetical protein
MTALHRAVTRHGCAESSALHRGFRLSRKSEGFGREGRDKILATTSGDNLAKGGEPWKESPRGCKDIGSFALEGRSKEGCRRLARHVCPPGTFQPG